MHWRFGLRSTLGTDCGGIARVDLDRLDGGRTGVGAGDAVRKGDCALGDDERPNKAESAGRDLRRPMVGMVRRSAAVLEDGVEGRVGGTS